MRAVIISGGEISDYDYIKSRIMQFCADIIICADSGYNHAVKMELAVNLIAGDFDSIGKIPENIETARYPSEKNQTDTEIALSHAREAGAQEFLIVGATGTRTDHMLTNIFMLKNCLECGERAAIIDEHNRIRITDSKLEIKDKKDSIISLVPLTDCIGVTTEGLKYPLKSAELKLGEGFGVSNVMIGDKALVLVDKGIMLVIEARD
ncbi:MAG: thiamine diphosphokinase [Oscillospiraceae bacterium]|jgi:thiamine pyrophosphokinase|nr:thiamine diphosphokinase [Oscillospiraceae bacterium]